MNFSDADAQRLINIIDQRIEERMRQERPRFGVIATVDTAVGLCSAYFSGETTSDYASPYFRYPAYLRPKVGDMGMFIASLSGERRLIDLFHPAGGGEFGRESTNQYNLTDAFLRVKRTNTGDNILDSFDGTNIRFHVEMDGKHYWHDTSGSADTTLERSAPSTLSLGTNDSLIVGDLLQAARLIAKEADDARNGSSASSNYPDGLSWFQITSSSATGWPNSATDARGHVVTWRNTATHAFQVFFAFGGSGGFNEAWYRAWNSNTAAWRAWVKLSP